MKANEIQLTAEELELIKVAREKKEQEQLVKQKEINDRIDFQKQNAMKAMLRGEQQVKATYDFFKGFKSGEFEVVEYPITKTMIMFSSEIRVLRSKGPNLFFSSTFGVCR